MTAKRSARVPKDSASAASDAEYKVGPGRPPKEYQFKPGQSGNPKGAKPKAPTLAPDLKELLKQALDRRVTFNQDKKTRTLTLFAAGIEQLVGQFVKGDRHARRDLFDLADKLGLDLLGSQKSSVEEALTSNHQAILQTYLEKQYDRVARRAPVLAPPELLDDDLDDQNRK